MEITSISKPETSTGSPFADLGYNYLWELINLGEYVPAFVGMQIFKDGFAKECYSGGFNGVQSRIINTLADMERSFTLSRGSLIGRLPFRVTGLFQDLRTKGEQPGGGSSEFYNMSEIQAKSRFANSWRQKNRALGLDIVTHKRDNGIHGCPVPLGQNEEPSYVEKAEKIRH